jgi:hypothetical protein
MKKVKPTYKQYLNYLSTANLTDEERETLTRYFKFTSATVGSYVSTLYCYAAIGSHSLLPTFLTAVAMVWRKPLAEVEASYRKQAAKAEANEQRALAKELKEIASLYRV